MTSSEQLRRGHCSSRRVGPRQQRAASPPCPERERPWPSGSPPLLRCQQHDVEEQQGEQRTSDIPPSRRAESRAFPGSTLGEASAARLGRRRLSCGVG